MRLRTCFVVVAAVAACLPLRAGTIVLDDGRAIDGTFATVSSVAEDPLNPKAAAGEVAVTPILLVDDGLRRVYVNKVHVQQMLDLQAERKIRIRVWQNVAETGGTVGRVGRSINVTPFDEFGRRIYEMQSVDGPLAVVQGITEITSDYCRVQGLVGQQRSIVWDMRLATTSIPRDTLDRILHQAVRSDDLDARLQIVRLYVQSKWFPDARKELQKIINDFPEAQDLAGELRQLQQLAARSILDEIELRRRAGQHTLVRTLLDNFPADHVASETLQSVRTMIVESDKYDTERTKVVENLKGAIGDIQDPIHRKLAEQFAAEVERELSPETMGRLAAFVLLLDDPKLTSQQKTAVALTGWILGTGNADETFAVAISLIEARDLVRAYLIEPEAAKRGAILASLKSLEAGTPERVALILRHMKPPEQFLQEWLVAPGCYQVPVESGEAQVPASYTVQLPPDYDPLRQYPTIVTLNGLGYRPELQLDYWAGAIVGETGRRGQAMRHGYITIAIDWLQPHQFEYEGSLREHRAVLACLADATRRLSIDSDRVFLTGHDIGGNAAWDIGLSHPDLWAGVIPLLSVPTKYVPRYRENGQYCDWYFIEGELDGGKMSTCASEFDRYLGLRFNSTVVEFQGRGFEPYSDEIQRLFDWMNRRKRRTPPAEFECSTMRPWDNFFWWAEVSGLPANSIVMPEAWPPARGIRASTVRGRKFATNKISLFTRAGQGTVWLSPDVIRFDEPLEVELNGRNLMGRERFMAPDLAVLLEDARTRGDRRHPFWAKLSWP